MTTPGVATTTPDACATPLISFIAAAAALVIVVFIIVRYIFYAHFDKLAFARRELLVLPTASRCLATVLALQSQGARSSQIVGSSRSTRHPLLKLIYMIFFSIFIVILSVFSSLFFTLSKVLFFSLLIYRSRSIVPLEPLHELIDNGLEAVAQVLSAPVVNALTLPVRRIIGIVANVKFNLDAANVSCLGAQAPLELLVNCGIVGAVIIFIASEYQGLWLISLPSLNNAYLTNQINSNTGSRGRNAVWRVLGSMGFLLLSYFNPFQATLQYLMTFVSLSKFIENAGFHNVTEACNQSK
jgi:hypothetical protein